jgi:hypothetical protein
MFHHKPEEKIKYTIFSFPLLPNFPIPFITILTMITLKVLCDCVTVWLCDCVYWQSKGVHTWLDPSFESTGPVYGSPSYSKSNSRFRISQQSNWKENSNV